MAEDYKVHLQKALISANYEQKLAKGLREVVKALESTNRDGKRAALCVLADDVTEADIKKLVTSLCKSYGIPLLKIESAQQLGEWIGLCKHDAQGNARDIRSCSSAVIREFVTQDEVHKQLILEHAEKI